MDLLEHGRWWRVNELLVDRLVSGAFDIYVTPDCYCKMSGLALPAAPMVEDVAADSSSSEETLEASSRRPMEPRAAMLCVKISYSLKNQEDFASVVEACGQGFRGSQTQTSPKDSNGSKASNHSKDSKDSEDSKYSQDSRDSKDSRRPATPRLKRLKILTRLSAVQKPQTTQDFKRLKHYQPRSASSGTGWDAGGHRYDYRAIAAPNHIVEVSYPSKPYLGWSLSFADTDFADSGFVDAVLVDAGFVDADLVDAFVAFAFAFSRLHGYASRGSVLCAHALRGCVLSETT